MMSLDLLPDFELSSDGTITAMVRAEGVESFRAAAVLLQSLPYGRNTRRSDYELVLQERRGTCSTKHALLAALATEHDVEIELRLGVYEMTIDNTPGVEPALSAFGFDAVPEAHCYVAVLDRRIDVTTPASTVKRWVDALLHEETIRPDQIGAYKVGVHREHVERWAVRAGIAPSTVWAARESCIRALSERDS